MALSRHTLLLSFATALVVAFVFAVPVAAAQEETTTSATEEVLSRFSTPATQEMARESEANEVRREELEAEIEALEEAGEYGPERSAVREELLEIPDAADEADALGSARLRDTAAAPVEGTDEEKAAELRRKAETAYAVDDSLRDVRLKAEHDNYVLFGDSPAAKAAEKYETEASVLEAVPEQTTEETTEVAAPGDGGGEQPVEEPEAAPDEPAPEPETSSGPGFLSGILGGINPAPILALVVLVGLAIYAFSRNAGMSVKGYLSPAMASVKKPKPRPSKPSPKKTEAATSKTTNLEEPEEERRTKKTRPEVSEDPDEIPDAAFDSEALQEWFDMEGPGEKPDEGDQGDEEPPDDEDPRL